MGKVLHLDMRYSTFLLIALLCIIFYYGHQSYGFSTNSRLIDHLLFHYSHANVFHMLANLLALFIFRPRLSTSVVAFICATIASYVPFASHEMPTMGLSAFIFAAYSRKFYFHSINPCRLIFLQVIFMIIPGVNWIIHIASFLIGYAYWMGYDTYHTLKYYHLL